MFKIVGMALGAVLALALAWAQTPGANMDTQLIAAAEQGNTPRVLQLLAAGARLNAQDPQGRTAILAATHGNKPETVATLVKAGADVNLRDNRLDNPFLYAGAAGLLEVLKALAPAKPSTRIYNRFGGTALIPACERGHVEVVKYLLEQTDVEVNHVNNLGWTGLLEAIILSNGGPRHQQIVQILIVHGAKVNLADKDGVTPLQHAQRRGFREIVQLLQAAGAR